MNISYFFRLSIGCHDVVPIIASGDETKQPERDEREESDGQSGEGLRPNSSKAPKILHDYRLLFCMIYSNANDHTDDVFPSQVSCWRKKWIEIPNTTLRQFKWVRSTQDSQVVVRCSTNIIMILGSQENEQE